MLPSLPRCGIRSIPSRLHTKNRQKRSALDREDRLFIRHAPLEEGCEYGFQIPGHDHLEDQSANSERLNNSGGYACDVLFDCKNGNHHVTFQIACIDIFRVRELAIPNENTIRKGRDGTIIQAADIYTFEPIHEPVPCMYPHCVIRARKNNSPAKKVSSGIKTAI